MGYDSTQFQCVPCGEGDQTSSDFIDTGTFRQDESLIDNASAQVREDQ